ncbi:MAG: glycerophosphodiester phosphodiesterase [Myxococcales bacterium]|nr:glycerophosphodiester phosphodiesterase [Myxococcales bacterium]
MPSAPPILYAHRGASSELPENTLPAFERALELGADALETDVHMTADGVLVVSHDASGLRQAGVPGRIAAASLAEVRSWDVGRGFVAPDGSRPFAGRGFRIPTVLELCEAFPGTRLNLDVKQHERHVVRALCALLRRLGREETTTLASFSGRMVHLARTLGFRGPTALVHHEVVALVLAPAAAARLVRPARRRAQIPVRVGPLDLGSRAFIDKCHAFGVAVDFWTVDAPDEAARLLDHGADGIMSDAPGGLAALFAARRGAGTARAAQR